MKKWKDLSKEEKEQAKDAALVRILEAIIERGFRFDDKANRNNLQERIDEAFKQAEEMQTPWFAHEYIMDTCRDDLKSIADAIAIKAFYPSRTDLVLYID